MEQVKLPFRADIVGSFLRPERLKKARKDFESGLLSPAELQQIEDEEIEKFFGGGFIEHDSDQIVIAKRKNDIATTTLPTRMQVLHPCQQ